MPKHRGTHDPSPAPSWRFTKVMNMSDLSKDDDFLSHLFVEKLGTGGVPLFVHKMDSSRRLPKTDVNDILQIVRRLVASKAPPSVAIREAVDGLFLLRPISYYLSNYTDKQSNAFATHASRYIELYLPNGSIEIAHTSRYAHATGKSELCILATRQLLPGAVITELKGSMADLTDDEDRELKCATATGQAGIRRDFSVIHSKQLKKNHLFLGPARFVNHDCGNNVELFREGRYITFRVIKPIAVGEEVTAHYGDDYFGRNNRHCLCQTCEDVGRGGYTPEEGVDPPSDSDSDTSDHSSQRTKDSESAAPLNVNVNERRTRRGVYAVMPENQIKEREQSTIPKIELDAEDSLLSLTFPSPSTSDRALLETPQLSRESSTISKETSKPGAVVRTSARLRGRPSKSSSLGPRPSRLATPEGPLCSSSRGRTSETEPPEQRVLRPRAPDIGVGKNPSGKGEGSSKQPNPTKKPVPKGVPTCVICKGILPVISVDSEIVWGLEGYDEKGKKLKGRKASSLECPRCMRHREIYNVTWPYRLASHGGTAYPTPPPADPPVSAKHRQESQEASTSQLTTLKAMSKNRRDDEDQRPTKRQKVEPAVAVPPVERDRSGRLHIPSRKLRESAEDDEKTILTSQEAPRAVSHGSKPRQPQNEMALRPAKKSRAERADERSKIREQMEKAQLSRSHPPVTTKNPISDVCGGPEGEIVRPRTSSRKRQRTEEHISVKRSCSVEAAEASEILASPIPHPPVLGIRGLRKGGYSGFLGVAPNPMNMARRKWIPVVPDLDSPDESIADPADPPPRAESSMSSTTEDSLQLNTPRDSDAVNPDVNSSGETEGVQATRRPHAFLNRAMKPSPVNFAMRRWSSMDSPKSDRSETDSQDELDDSMPRKLTTVVDIAVLSSPESSRRPSGRFTTPEPRSYVPSRIWEMGDDRAPLESPDSSLFALRHKATFTSSPGGGSFTDDSERMVERLVYADSPSRDEPNDVQHVIDVAVKTSGFSKNNVEGIVEPLPCIGLELEKVFLPTNTMTSFATVSAGSKLIRAGRDPSR